MSLTLLGNPERDTTAHGGWAAQAVRTATKWVLLKPGRLGFGRHRDAFGLLLFGLRIGHAPRGRACGRARGWCGRCGRRGRRGRGRVARCWPGHHGRLRWSRRWKRAWPLRTGRSWRGWGQQDRRRPRGRNRRARCSDRCARNGRRRHYRGRGRHASRAWGRRGRDGCGRDRRRRHWRGRDRYGLVVAVRRLRPALRSERASAQCGRGAERAKGAERGAKKSGAVGHALLIAPRRAFPSSSGASSIPGAARAAGLGQRAVVPR